MMKKWAYRISILCGMFLSLIILGAHTLDKFMRYTDRDIYSFFSEKNVAVDVKITQDTSLPVRWVKTFNNDKDKCIIFIHGAPGGWDAFREYMVDSLLLEKAELISYDRPGYGTSYDGKAVESLSTQSLALQGIREAAGCDHYILVGHSYGGPVAVKNAIDHPQGLDGVVLIAPAIDPFSEKYFWFAGLTWWPWSKWVWPVSFRIVGKEKRAHSDQLKLLSKKIHELKVPTLLIHSTDDAIVPAEGNIRFLNEHLPSGILHRRILYDKGHLLIWKDKELVRDMILDFIR